MRAVLNDRRTRELAFALLVAVTVWPLVQVHYLPIQDLPQHLAAIRVLHSYGDPAFDFERYFELDLFRTQYLAYYLATHLLAFVFDLELANRLLVIACVAGTPYALRSLLRSLGRDERWALFALPLAYNAHLILGFVNFLMAIALTLYGLSLAVQQRRAPRLGRSLGLAALALVTFYAHVVPFALFALGAGLIALTRDPKRLALGFAPLVPAGLAGLSWIAESPAGRATLTAAGGGGAAAQPMFAPAAFALADLPNWLTDVLHGELDRQLLRWFGLLLVLAFCIGALPLERAVARTSGAEPALLRSLWLRIAWLAPLAALLYFVAPTGYDWIWPIAQRFPLLALLFAIPLLPTPPRALGRLFACALIAITLMQVREVSRAFEAFERDEVADFDQALDHIPAAQRVVALIFARGSRQVKFSPFIQYAAYYQARKGGAVMFTFADFPQSPFRFRETDRPPRVPPRWEWLPGRVRASELGWYDYLLVRGGAGPCASSRPTGAIRCTPEYRGPAWQVWKLH